METINKRTLNDGYKVIGTISEIKVESDASYSRPRGTIRESIYDYNHYEQPPLKFKYNAKVLTKLGEISIPVSKEFADEMGANGTLGTTLEITIVRK